MTSDGAFFVWIHLPDGSHDMLVYEVGVYDESLSEVEGIGPWELSVETET